ncbi:uncharacterized protein JCM6883_000704 [Sporobolomyces salmoneus]|uniref:uncharacterized protein n=1 Tax=Sporobolomyces salmoneus TaxID=183962 RepID=UPI003171B0F0
MSFYDRFRQPGGDLASFFRSLTTPTRRYTSERHEPTEYEWELFRARQGGTKRLDFFDANLRGPQGATSVLGELQRSPAASSISLSQNELGDDGVRELLVGMKRLRAKDIGSHLQEINLSGCGLSDVALYLVTLHLLQPSPHPPSITHLYLTGNNLSLSLSSLPEFLGKTLSSPSSSVQCFSLTNNPSIGTAGLTALLPHLKLAEGPSQLSQLHLSVCGLTPDAAEPLARWLEDPNGGGRLQVLAVNGCTLSQAGVRRIARAVTSGKASSLIHFEYHANDEGESEEWREVIDALEAEETEEDRTGWKEKLEAAKERNKQVYKETRLTALSLVSAARVLFGGNACEAQIDVSEILEEVDSSRPGSTVTGSRSFSSPQPFPFLRLPIELQVHVLRCLPLLRPSRLAHLYPSLDSACPIEVDPSTLSSPLTEAQFLRILSHCANRSTLKTEIRIVEAQLAGSAPSLNSTRARPAWAERQNNGEAGGGNGWEEWFLRSTGCDRFERAGSLR